MEQTITMIAVAITAIVLISASIYDWRFREIPDWHWMILFLMAIGLSILVTVRESLGAPGIVMVGCIALIAFDCTVDRYYPVKFDLILYVSIAITAFTALRYIDADVAHTFISIPIMYAAMNILYYTGIIKGGADAKSIIAISAVFPTYPELMRLPIIAVPDTAASSVFVPAFAVLTMALVISLLYGLFNIILNLIRRDVEFPQMFMGTRMPLEKAKKSKVWPMEDIVGDEVIDTTTANEDADIWKKLEEHGAHEIWVTAIIPFLIPITIAFSLMITIGFPLFIL